MAAEDEEGMHQAEEESNGMAANGDFDEEDANDDGDDEAAGDASKKKKKNKSEYRLVFFIDLSSSSLPDECIQTRNREKEEKESSAFALCQWSCEGNTFQQGRGPHAQ